MAPTPMTDQLFRDRADSALSDLFRRLTDADDLPIEADFNSGALSIEFEDPPAKFVVSPNSPVRQVWVSAHSKSFKLDWDDSREAFVLAPTGQTLIEMIAAAIGQQLDETVDL